MVRKDVIKLKIMTKEVEIGRISFIYDQSNSYQSRFGDARPNLEIDLQPPAQRAILMSPE